MLPESLDAEIAQIRELIGAQSDSEVIRRALKLFKRLANPDLEIIIIDPKVDKEIRLIIV